jgi:CBS domain-containing protein
MRVEEIMTDQVITVGPEEPARTAWSRMQRERIRHLIVVDGKRLLGVLSERDLGGRDGTEVRRGRLVRDLMTEQVATVKPGTSLRQAANLMRGRLIGSLPVVEKDRVVGIVTATDVLEELGRGSTRPAVAAKRRSMRLAPASARAAARRARDRGRRARRSGKETKDAGTHDAEPAAGKGAAPAGRIMPALGRDRERLSDSAQRAPMADSLPRPVKRGAGRTETALTTAYIRSVGTALEDADRDYLRRKLGRKLGKFARSIERVSVRIEDINGPRGGIDKRCRIKVVMSGLPSAMVDERHPVLQAAMDRALERTEHAVRRIVGRRQVKAIGRGGAAGRTADLDME